MTIVFIWQVSEGAKSDGDEEDDGNETKRKPTFIPQEVSILYNKTAVRLLLI